MHNSTAPRTRTSTLALAAALAILTLAGCTKGGGISMSTEATTGVDESRKMDLSKSKTMTASTSAKITATAPAAQLIAQSLRPLVALAEIDMPAYVRSVKHEAGALFPPALVPSEAQAIALKARLAGPFSDVVQMYAAPKLSACADLVIANKSAQACFDDFYAHAHAAAAMLAASWPQKTPGIKGESVDMISKERSFPKGPLQRWISGSVAVLDFSNELQRIAAKTLDRTALSDPDTAQLAVAVALFSMPVADLLAQAAVKAPVSAVVSNGELNAPLEVFVPEANEYLAQSEKGLVVTRNGAVWFGDGFISGKKLDIALESTSSASLERKRGLVLEQSDKAGTSTKAGVGLQ